jgi:hypothetical protein
MKLAKRIPTGREKDQAAVELLEELRQKLYNDNSSVARRAAFNLSWMQEDGLEILEEALFSNASRRVKSAACYGLRSMHGRMKKVAAELIRKGSQSSDDGTRDVCITAIGLMERPPAEKKAKPKKQPRRGRFQIREMKGRKKRRPISHTSPLPGRFNSDRRPRR